MGPMAWESESISVAASGRFAISRVFRRAPCAVGLSPRLPSIGPTVLTLLWGDTIGSGVRYLRPLLGPSLGAIPSADILEDFSLCRSLSFRCVIGVRVVCGHVARCTVDEGGMGQAVGPGSSLGLLIYWVAGLPHLRCTR